MCVRERMDGQNGADNRRLYQEVRDAEMGSETGWMDWSSRMSVDNGQT